MIFSQSALNAEESLAACLTSRDTLEHILDSVSDGIMTVDGRLQVAAFNRAAGEITGFSREEALGSSCIEVFRQILSGQECLVCRALEKREYVRDVEREIVRKGGDRRLVLVTTTPLVEAGGERPGAVVVFRDIQENPATQRAVKRQVPLPPTCRKKSQGTTDLPPYRTGGGFQRVGSHPGRERHR